MPNCAGWIIICSLWLSVTKWSEHLNGTGSRGGVPGVRQLGTTSVSSERSHKQSKCGMMSVRLRTRTTASASRSACT
eukprot:5868383-Prymnesium_polylepis.2